MADTDSPRLTTGWHGLEYDLWVAQDASGSAEAADQLHADPPHPRDGLDDLEITPLAVAKGASELIEEVAEGKITGEEDRYSHTDLWDLAANVEGARAATDLLLPAITEADADLAEELETAFTEADEALASYRGPGRGLDQLHRGDRRGPHGPQGQASPPWPRSWPRCREPWSRRDPAGGHRTSPLRWWGRRPGRPGRSRRHRLRRPGERDRGRRQRARPAGAAALPRRAPDRHHLPVLAAVLLMASFDLVADDRGEVREVFEELTEEFAALMSGTPVPDRGQHYPPLDTGSLGTEPPPADLALTLAIGAVDVRRPLRPGRPPAP